MASERERELEAENERLRGHVAALRAEIEKLRALIEELRRKNHRPHAPFSKGPPKPDPKPPGRKGGSAHGRHAHRPPPGDVDEVYEAALPPSCPCCGGTVEHEAVAEQFQVEIPRKPIRRRFDIHLGRCRACGKRVQGRHALQTSDALGAAQSQIGPDAQALAVLLNKEAGLSHGKVTRFFDAAFGIALSRGGSAKLMLRAAERCRGAFGELRLMTRVSRRCCADETGWKVGGVLQWLWVFVTEAATLYLIRPSRGADVVAEALGRDYAGALTHDGWCAYDPFAQAAHGQCQNHLLRRCATLLETARRGAARLPHAVKALLQDGLALRDRREAGESFGHGLAVAAGRLEARLNRLLAGTYRHEPNARFVRHLSRHREGVLAYLRNAWLDATNYRGEQGLRPAVLLRKVWGGSRTWRGARAQGVLLSILRTCAQRGQDRLAFLSRTLRAPPGLAPRLITT